MGSSTCSGIVFLVMRGDKSDTEFARAGFGREFPMRKFSICRLLTDGILGATEAMPSSIEDPVAWLRSRPLYIVVAWLLALEWNSRAARLNSCRLRSNF